MFEGISSGRADVRRRRGEPDMKNNLSLDGEVKCGRVVTTRELVNIFGLSG